MELFADARGLYYIRMSMKTYDHKKIEKKWQKEWARKGLYKTNDKALRQAQGKCYTLDMFPYPSGEGLHVGHPKGYIATDIYSRYKRMRGMHILHPMGWDAFGLPAENYAIKNKVHPEVAVKKNIKRFKEQLGKIGFNYDWSREINTTDPEYYKWTQWIFLKMFEAGLAYESYEPINWCPSCQTGLANEDLDEGRCERCGSVVEKKPMRQWMLKITNYADRLLEDLNTLEWPEHIKQLQREWIGRSEGAEIEFKVKDLPHSITVFTTRADTLYGVTYVVLAPEHPIIKNLQFSISNFQEVEKYVREAKTKTEIERTAEGKEKTGVRLAGVFAIHPLTGEELPVWVADYVLGNYGTGAVMAVPAHDERDYQFAKRYELPIRQVVAPLFEITEGQDAVRHDKQTVKRKTVYCIVKHWKEDKILILDWKKFGWHSFVIGGIEDKENEVEASIREIQEETGYKNIKFVRKIGGEVHSNFYAGHKNENRYSLGHTLYFELQNDEKDEISEDEKAKHEAKWVETDKVGGYINLANNIFSWEEFLHGEKCFSGNGILMNSGEMDGLDNKSGAESIVLALESQGKGTQKVAYKLRDWVFSRQRYWGEPIPLVHCEKDGVVPVPEKDLPVKLPKVKKYAPTGTGESPLADIAKWVNVKCPKCGGPAKRETNTMPQWAGSSWYYLRYIDPKNKKALVDKKKEEYWSPVDMYVGGAEHATRHLIYARFWHKFLFDIGVAGKKEPFSRLRSVGLILAEDGKKMSKRWGNVVNPDDIVALYGADSLRLYEMFMGPFENAIAWNTESVIGVRRFLEKIWRLKSKVTRSPTSGIQEVGLQNIETVLHKTIKKVTEDIEEFKFNTAVSSLMILVNEMEKSDEIKAESYKLLLQLLAPFAPHIAEELWHGNLPAGKAGKSIHVSSWPSYDASKIKEENIRIAVQVDGRVRGAVTVPAEAAEAEIIALADALPQVKKWINGRTVLRVVYVPNRLINYVCG
jgi:leucyl-tRNA synthetase